MIKIFEQMVITAKDVGTVKAANMYNDGFMTVEGETKDGKKFSLTLCVKEEEKDA